MSHLRERIYIFHAAECLHDLEANDDDHHIVWGQVANPLYMYFHNAHILQQKIYSIVRQHNISREKAGIGVHCI